MEAAGKPRLFHICVRLFSPLPESGANSRRFAAKPKSPDCAHAASRLNKHTVAVTAALGAPLGFLAGIFYCARREHDQSRRRPSKPLRSKSGLSDTDPVFNAFNAALIQLLANGLPPSMVGDAYAQLLQMNDPVQNVAVGSPREPLATQGGNTLVEQELVAENQMSAVPFKPGK